MCTSLHRLVQKYRVQNEVLNTSKDTDNQSFYTVKARVQSKVWNEQCTFSGQTLRPGIGYEEKRRVLLNRNILTKSEDTWIKLDHVRGHTYRTSANFGPFSTPPPPLSAGVRNPRPPLPSGRPHFLKLIFNERTF